jgi:hypothetical protein
LSRLALVIISILVGSALAVGAAFAVSGVSSAKPKPASQQLYNYGSP